MKQALLLIILFCCPYNTLAQKQMEVEEYEVYKSLLGNGSKLLVSRFTNYQEINHLSKSPEVKRELSILQSETRKSYRENNRISAELQNIFDIQPTVKLVTSEELRPFFDKLKESEIAAENALIEKYGTNTLIHLSRVGFNKSKNQALVAAVYNSGLCGTCSTSYLYILSKAVNHWVVKKKIMLWIS